MSIGRELKVSELAPEQVVAIWKEPLAFMATMRVHYVAAEWVMFQASGGMHFVGARTGPGMDRLTDDAGAKLKIYEFHPPKNELNGDDR